MDDVLFQIFPINIKGSAGSLVTLSHWFCSWITTYTFNFVFEWSSAGDLSLPLHVSPDIGMHRRELFMAIVLVQEHSCCSQLSAVQLSYLLQSCCQKPRGEGSKKYKQQWLDECCNENIVPSLRHFLIMRLTKEDEDSVISFGFKYSVIRKLYIWTFMGKVGNII